MDKTYKAEEIHQTILADESFRDLVRYGIETPTAAIITRDILSAEVSTK